MPRNKKINRSKEKPFSRENHCGGYSGEQSVAQFFVHQPESTLHTISEIKDYLKTHYRELSHGTLLNILSHHKRRGFIESFRGIPTLYRLLDASGNPIHPIHPIGVTRRQRNAVRPLKVEIDLPRYLKTLQFEDVARIHDIKLWTPIEDLGFVTRNWKRDERQKRFWRREMIGDRYRFSISVYEKANTLTVDVACANSPVSVDERGLSNLNEALWLAWHRFFNSSVPPPNRWIVKQWHFGKDAKKTIGGLSFETTWTDFYGNLIRVYTRDKFNGKVRVERVENPDDFVETLLGSPGYPIKKIMRFEETTCVDDAPSAVMMEIAPNMLMESRAFDAVDVGMSSMTQNLHV